MDMGCNLLSGLEKNLVKSTAMGLAPGSGLSRSAVVEGVTDSDSDTGKVIEGNLIESALDARVDMP